MQELIDQAARLVKSSRQYILRFNRHSPGCRSFRRSFRRFLVCWRNLWNPFIYLFHRLLRANQHISRLHLSISCSSLTQNLIHHIVKICKINIMAIMLIFLANVSNKYYHDDDYPATNLEKKVAGNQQLLLKTLLIQRDFENLISTDILLFKI